MTLHFGRPDGVDWKKYYIFSPLFQDFLLYLSVRFEFQRVYEVFKKGESLLHFVPKFGKLSYQKLNDHFGYS